MSKTDPQCMQLSVMLLSLLLITLLAVASCAGPPPQQVKQQPGQVIAKPSTPVVSDNQASQQAVTENITPVIYQQENTLSEPAAPIQIALIHYKGTLQPLGCCSPGLYETDEFVVIQNFSDVPQDIRGWKLVNVTKGYPSFTFPANFPCVPFHPTDMTPYVVSAPQSLEQRMTTYDEAVQKKSEDKPVKIDWSLCGATEPLDQTRMEPLPGQQGQSLPCILYPGQSVLVFTDEIHCKHGGLSFNYGNGNIWNNSRPDTAVLYNARGEEVSRRSYQVK